MNVDWEERWNVERLRTYRLGRARDALAASELGAVLLFDFNNIRYVTSTHIGEWARDKMTRYALLTRGGDPHIWDFGSAAKHHRLNCPWLRQENIHAGMVGLRGAVAPEAGLFRRAAREICEIRLGEMPRRLASRRRLRPRACRACRSRSPIVAYSGSGFPFRRPLATAASSISLANIVRGFRAATCNDIVSV